MLSINLILLQIVHRTFLSFSENIGERCRKKVGAPENWIIALWQS